MAKYRIQSAGRMSNRQYHAQGKPTWWARIGSGDDARFVTLPRIRGDEKLNVIVSLDAEDDLHIGVGKGDGGVRETVTPLALEQKTFAVFGIGQAASKLIREGKPATLPWPNADEFERGAQEIKAAENDPRRFIVTVVTDASTLDAATDKDDAVLYYEEVDAAVVARAEEPTPAPEAGTFIAMEINTILAIFRAFGPFSSKAAAEAWAARQAEPRSFAVLEMKEAR
jgi:hypothetical protein